MRRCAPARARSIRATTATPRCNTAAPPWITAPGCSWPRRAGASRAGGAALDPLANTSAALQYRGAALAHRAWLELAQPRGRFARAWDAFFARHDVLLCPAAATAAFPLDEAGEPWQRTLTVNGQP